MAAPCVLVTSCTEWFRPSDMVKELLCVDTLADGTALLETILSYPWHVNTKYYTADVQICTTDTRTIGDQQFAETVEAFLVYFSSNDESSFEQVKAWLPFLNEINPDVLLLVCDKCSADDVVSRKTIQEWCIEHSFELIEMSPDLEEFDEEDDFTDSYGITRIQQALQAHTWPNLVMKDEPTIRSPYFQQLMREEAKAIALDKQSTHSIDTLSEDSVNRTGGTPGCEHSPNVTGGTSADCPLCRNAGCDSAEAGETNLGTAGDGHIPQDQAASNKHTERKQDELLDSMLSADQLALFEALGSEDPDGGSFETLFSNLRLMKEKAETLPAEDRKAYAETVAVSFWRAMGGGDDEIADLSDSSND